MSRKKYYLIRRQYKEPSGQKNLMIRSAGRIFWIFGFSFYGDILHLKKAVSQKRILINIKKSSPSMPLLRIAALTALSAVATATFGSPRII